tara:strand:+ start:17 stop:499 length:483 start_codon:yes stop_codon:yes gene_type:complete
LGKMVKIFKSVLIISMSLSVSGNLPILSKKEFAERSDLSYGDEIAQIFSLPSSRNGISDVSSSVGKPSEVIIKNMKLLSPTDRYALRILDSDRNEIFIIGLGNPFYIHAQHIGYEDSDSFGTYIDADIQIALPIDNDASYFVLLSQENKFLKKINEIKIR